MTVDEHVRPATEDGVWDASHAPGGSDLIIESDEGFTRHCLVGYDLLALSPIVDWDNLTPDKAAALCASRVGLDLRKWEEPIAAVQSESNDFSEPSAVVAMRSQSGLLAQCFMVEGLPPGRGGHPGHRRRERILAPSRSGLPGRPLPRESTRHRLHGDRDRQRRADAGVRALWLRPRREIVSGRVDDIPVGRRFAQTPDCPCGGG